jgi:putative endopeptidase
MAYLNLEYIHPSKGEQKMESENKTRIQDDLYEYVNGEWLSKAVIPDDKPSVGGFADLDTGVEKILMGDFKAMKDGTLEIPNKYLEDAIKLYSKGLDVKRRNKEGLLPLKKSLKKIASIKTMRRFNSSLLELVLADYPLPVKVGVQPDMKNTLVNSFIFTGPDTILPDTTYYAEGNKTGEALLGIWKTMAAKLLAFSPLSEEEQKQYLEDTMAFDKLIAPIVKSQEEWADYVKCYNPMPLDVVAKKLKGFDIKGLLASLYGDKIPTTIIAYDPKFTKNFKKMFNRATYPLYQHWAYTKFIVSSSSLLSEEIRTIGGTYRRALSGIAVDASIEKQAYRAASNVYSEPLGIYYGKKYFGEEAKKDVVEMVKEIIATYKKRMSENSFLEEKTKEKAILKLDKIVIKMGYPEVPSKKYEALSINDKDSFYEAMSLIDVERNEYDLKTLNEPVVREDWVMPGHMVNACYNPYSNDITFPAAILQAPFYSLKQSRSENLGGIGTVIGHEISHAFDNNGAQCDENGNLANWWSKEDFKAFKKATKKMIKEFDGIPFHGGKVNGAFVVSENIADNGGMAVTLDIMSKMADPDYEAYFINFAKLWCMKAREQYMQLLLSVDVHSPAELRANMQPRNFDEWYKTFKVKKTDKMYLVPSKRVHIW